METVLTSGGWGAMRIDRWCNQPRWKAYFSAIAFMLASPFSKSLPTIESMLKNNVVITFNMYGCRPCIAQMTFVESACGSSENSAVLWASNGFKKSSLMMTFLARMTR